MAPGGAYTKLGREERRRCSRVGRDLGRPEGEIQVCLGLLSVRREILSPFPPCWG